jgi:DNA invertase Pin-like site-specific DNA recombinase
MNVFAYTRVSGLSQAEGDGPARQLIAIQRWAGARAVEIVRQFNETFTGKSELAHRPMLAQLREEMLAGDVKTVVIEKLDRLARDLLYQEAIIKDFQRHGLTIISTMEEDLCSTDPTRKLIRQILGAFAEYERVMIVNKLAEARQRKQARGDLILGKPPYGYKKRRHDNKVGLEEDRFEQAILNRIRGMRNGGYTYKAIADELNGLAIPTRDSATWFPATVQKILAKAKPG